MAGNEVFVTGVTKWLLHQRGVLRFGELTHHKASSAQQPDAYRIKDQVLQPPFSSWQTFGKHSCQVCWATETDTATAYRSRIQCAVAAGVLRPHAASSFLMLSIVLLAGGVFSGGAGAGGQCVAAFQVRFPLVLSVRPKRPRGEKMPCQPASSSPTSMAWPFFRAPALD